MKETKASLEQRLRIIKLRFNCDLELDWMAGRPRVGRADHSRYVSPRGSKNEIALWLDGFIEALELNGMEVESCKPMK